jgi:hypothetical protein
MGEKSDGRKKTLLAILLAFLLLGGGVFMFFVFQGLGDLKGGDQGDFSYGFVVKSALLPISNYFSLVDDDTGLARRTGEKLPSGSTRSLRDVSSADISDWMDKPDAGDKAGGGSDASSKQSGRTSIPRISGGLGGSGSSGGGGSKSSAEAAKFSSGAQSGNVKISRASGPARMPAEEKPAALSVLRSVRAEVGEGLKSDSAMAAKASWDRSFGAAKAAGKKSAALAYGRAGLVGLDHIKSGEVGSLKTSDAKSLKIAEPAAPERDKESEANDGNLKKMNGDLGADAAKQAMTSSVGAVGDAVSKSGQPQGGRSKVEMPPPEIIELATTPPPKGTFCPEGCDGGKNGAYTDKELTYKKNQNGIWQGIYTGTQGSVDYRDTVNLYPGKDPPWELVGTSVMQDGVWVGAVKGGVAPLQ